MKFLMTLLVLATSFNTWAEDLPLHPTLQEVVDADVYKVYVEIPLLGAGVEVSWTLNATQKDVLLGQLAAQPQLSHPYDALYEKLANPLEGYGGVVLRFETYHGASVPELRVFDGRVRTTLGGSLVRPDAGRELELWVWGTAKTRKQQLLAVQAVPIFSFDQCVALGNLVIESTPRQCLLPDNNLLLENDEEITVADLAITDFDTCLKDGRAIIDAFPRRCLAKGGRVFTEPPRLIEVDDTPIEVDLDAFIEEWAGEGATSADVVSETVDF